MTEMSDACIRASWEAERENMRTFLSGKRFNPKYVDRVVSNFINSMVYAKIPCYSESGIKAAYSLFALNWRRTHHGW